MRYVIGGLGERAKVVFDSDRGVIRIWQKAGSENENIASKLTK